MATELYHELTREGFKVFFSRITLEDKLGVAYEPYIFAALNSSKVMVVLGTRPEHFNAVWVKNEWSRFLALIKNGAKKTLIPAYRDMDPYGLPKEFSHLQAQDMSKLGFMQDLTRGIKKIVESNTEKQIVRETVVTNQTIGNIAALLKRGFMSLEDEEWSKADDFFEQCLNQNAELAEAYLGKLMAELHVRTQDSLKDYIKPFDDSSNYQKIIRFGSQELAAKIKTANQNIHDKIQLKEIARPKKELYDRAVSTFIKYNNDDFYDLNFRIRSMESAIKDLEKIYPLFDTEVKIKEYTLVVEKLRRRSRRVCQHCGDKFVGIFSKSCSKCGKNKDYR